MDPRDLTIVGNDATHPAYDPERLASFKLSEETLGDYAANGVLQDVIVRKEKQAPGDIYKRDGNVYGRQLPDGTWAVVFGGRGRVMHAFEMVKRGNADFKIPVRVERGDDLHMAGIVLSENAHRRDSDVLTKARQAFRFYQRAGKDIKLTAQRCNVGDQAIRDWFSLLEASPKLHAAFTAGKITASPLIRLSRLARDEQERALDEMLATGQTSTASAEAQVKIAKASRPDTAPAPTVSTPTSSGTNGTTHAPAAPKPASKPRPAVPEGNAPKKRLVRAVTDTLPNTIQGNLLRETLLWVLDGTRAPEPIREAVKAARANKVRS